MLSYIFRTSFVHLSYFLPWYIIGIASTVKPFKYTCVSTVNPFKYTCVSYLFQGRLARHVEGAKLVEREKTPHVNEIPPERRREILASHVPVAPCSGVYRVFRGVLGVC